jgi:predicted PurR-regulated permease PerM
MDVSAHRINAATYVLAAVALLLILQLHLLPALLAGLLVYNLINSLTPRLAQHLRGGERARWLAVALLGALVAALLAVIILGLVAFFGSESGNPGTMFDRLMPVIDRARDQLPAWVVQWLPDSTSEIRAAVIDAIRKHAAQLQLAGKNAARVIAHLLIGLILGALVALDSARGTRRRGPLAAALGARARNLSGAFHDIVYAQVKISLLNTAFTGIFLLVVLPLFGVQLPFAKTLVVVTFVTGLLPVIGNLISNTLIFVVGLSVSLFVGVAALAFLIGIHKLEYFLNARIVGGRIRARAWEILIAMLLFEAAFGVAGLIAAPIYYAYLKRELETGGLI